MLKLRPIVLAATVLALVLPGCAQKSPIEQMESLREKHSASLNTFFATPNVAEVVEPEAEPSETDGAAAVDDGEDVAMAEPAPPAPTTSDITLDIVVRTESDEKLAGVTLDIAMAGADGREKGSWQLWLDTSSLARGPGTQIEHRLEEVDYEEGDGFHVEIRHPIPEGERSTYREYADAG